jgi:hypothetical protein
VISKDGSIFNFLKKKNPDRFGPYGIQAKYVTLIIQNVLYVLSDVWTYLPDLALVRAL